MNVITPSGWKNIVEKGENYGFLFPYNVFKGLLTQGNQNLGLDCIGI